MAISEEGQRVDLIGISVPFDAETVIFSKFNPGGRCHDLKAILETLCSRTGRCRMQSTCEYLDIVPDQADHNNYNNTKIDVGVLGEDISQIQQLEKRLRQEVAMVYFILAESATVNQTIDKKIISQVHWKPKSEPNASSQLMEMKLRIAWLTYELNRCQVRIIELAQNGSIVQTAFGSDVMITITPTPPNQLAVPLFRPLPDDCKPSNINLQMFALVREFIFNETWFVDKLDIKFKLVGRLEKGQWEQLRSSPHQFFLDMVRYIGLSGEEFIRACFHCNKDCEWTESTKCPCGAILQASDRGNDIFGHNCDFYEFVVDKCPSILQNNYYKCHAGRVMGLKETAYIVDVIKKRLPESVWMQTFVKDMNI